MLGHVYFVEAQMLDGKTLNQTSTSKTMNDREIFLKAVSAEMRKARERVDMTVSDLHRETGISRTVLQGYEAGRFVPGAMELKKLCSVLKVTPNKILFGEETPLENKPLLASFVGDVTKAGSTAKLAIVLQVLSSEELSSLLSLVESIVITRVGGAKKLQQLFHAVDVMVGSEETPGLVASIGEEVFKQLSEAQKIKIGIAAEEAFKQAPSMKVPGQPGLLTSITKEAFSELSEDQKTSIVVSAEAAVKKLIPKKRITKSKNK